MPVTLATGNKATVVDNAVEQRVLATVVNDLKTLLEKNHEINAYGVYLYLADKAGVSR